MIVLQLDKIPAEIEKAVESYQRAIAIKPEFAAALTNLGNALQEAGRIEVDFPD